jgi:RimJ/RimL family protein N-acetyltransferase
MIIEMTAEDFALLMAGEAPANLRLDPDVEVAPPVVLEMLAGLASTIAERFEPSAWMLTDGDEIVGLMSVTRLPAKGEIHIGYGVAPQRQGRGLATRAVAGLVAWARADARVGWVSADTGVDNIGSQRVLEHNGFAKVGGRVDAEDGPLICWRIATK